MLKDIGEMNLNIMLYIIIMAVLISLAISIRIKNGIIFKVIIRCVLAVGFICAINYASSFLENDISIPLNLVTTFTIAILNIPGIALVYIVKYIIYPI